jgi:electron-transferring-flavoprotein dehydrogenase
MEFDVVIVGAGPAGLATAIRLKQLASEAGKELSVCVIEKGAEVGAHIMSGAVLETRALDELLPDWKQLGAPIDLPVTEEQFLLLGERKAVRWPNALLIPAQKNHGNYIVSLANVCRWLGEQAEAAGVDIFPGFAANEVLFDDDGRVIGVATGDMGVDRNGQPKNTYQPGYELKGKYTVFAEGCRGHLGKFLIRHFKLDEGRDPQHYGIGIKEIWEVPEEQHRQGLVLHSTGWPLDRNTYGGSFMYHLSDRQVAVGFVVGLSYTNPYLSPFEEFQRFKTHPAIRRYLEGGTRIAYGARALNEGGWQSLPKLTFPGGMLVGCEAGTLNLPKIKGTHTAMKSGMLAAEAMAEVLFSESGEAPAELASYEESFRKSWAHEELYRARNVYPAFHKWGSLGGILYTGIDQILFRGKAPWTLHARTPDHAMLKKADEVSPIDYPKPDNKLTFDRLSSVYISNTNHEEDQPCHLKLKDPEVPIKVNLPLYAEPAQRYCPAGVYEVIEDSEGQPRFQINAQNCVHCKTCDIKDPSQNIEWTAPEGGGGPVYPNM